MDLLPFAWYPLTPDNTHDVIELHEALTPPGLTLELHLARVGGRLWAWWQTEHGAWLRRAEVGRG